LYRNIFEKQADTKNSLVWGTVQQLFCVGLTSKNLEQSSSEYAPIAHAGPSGIQAVCVWRRKPSTDFVL